MSLLPRPARPSRNSCPSLSCPGLSSASGYPSRLPVCVAIFRAQQGGPSLSVGGPAVKPPKGEILRPQIPAPLGYHKDFQEYAATFLFSSLLYNFSSFMSTPYCSILCWVLEKQEWANRYPFLDPECDSVSLKMKVSGQMDNCYSMPFSFSSFGSPMTFFCPQREVELSKAIRFLTF